MTTELRQCMKPHGKLEPDREQGETIIVRGWEVRGYRDPKGRYFECARRGEIERWFVLD